jgi:hypothetical protein
VPEFIEVRGIDRDSESRSMLFAVDEPVWALASALCTDGWKYAQLQRDGTVIGEVKFSHRLMRRTWWAEGSGRLPMDSWE